MQEVNLIQQNLPTLNCGDRLTLNELYNDRKMVAVTTFRLSLTNIISITAYSANESP